MKNQGIYTKENVSEGVYIFTENGNYVSPKFWGVHELDEKPVGAAIIGERKLLVALTGSENSLELLDWNKDLKSEKFESLEDALKFDEGDKVTTDLVEMESDAATFCNDYECGQIAKGNWYIPTLKDMQFMYDNKKDLDIALAIAGGNAIETDDWHWTATRRYDKSHWIFDWNDGYRGYGNQDDSFRVRPVSASL